MSFLGWVRVSRVRSSCATRGAVGIRATRGAVEMFADPSPYSSEPASSESCSDTSIKRDDSRVRRGNVIRNLCCSTIAYKQDEWISMRCVNK